MKQLPLFALPLALAAFAFAAPAWAECNKTRCTGEIERLYVNANHALFTTTSDERRLNCQLEADQYIRLEFDHPAFKELYAMLLTAKSARLTTTLRIEEGSRGCRLSYALLE